jgi:dTDP-glucose 4,6-dehydratase
MHPDLRLSGGVCTVKQLLVTGGAGFIGSDFIRMVIAERPDLSVVNLDLLTYAGNLANLKACQESSRYSFVHGDVCDAALVSRVLVEKRVDAVVHFAAESHVDRSILGPRVFVETNVLGTVVLLQAAREAKLQRFLQVSTDEVYGSLGPEGKFSEETPIAPNSPYSASKAAADHLVRAFGRTYSMDVVITRCSNNYGPYQFPEKMIPLMIHNALADKPLPVYGDGLQVRDWIFVRDHSRAVLRVLEAGSAGEVYNVGGDSERTNLEVVKKLLDALGKPHTLIRHVEDRPGHDRRYAIDATKVRRELGWSPQTAFEGGLEQTIRWYRENGDWLRGVTSGEYQSYYERWYGKRAAAAPVR